MKLLATLLKKDLVVNQSDFQAKKKKRKALSKKEYRNRFAFKNSFQDLYIASLEEFATYVCLYELPNQPECSGNIIPHWVYFAVICKMYATIFKKKST